MVSTNVCLESCTSFRVHSTNIAVESWMVVNMICLYMTSHALLVSSFFSAKRAEPKLIGAPSHYRVDSSLKLELNICENQSHKRFKITPIKRQGRLVMIQNKKTKRCGTLFNLRVRKHSVQCGPAHKLCLIFLCCPRAWRVFETAPQTSQRRPGWSSIW